MQLLPLVVIVVAATYVTSIPCRLLYARNRRASWFLALAVAVAVGVLTVLVTYLGDVFTHPVGNPAFPSGLFDPFLRLVFIFSSIIGLIPSLVVLGYYRRRLRNKAREARQA